MFISHTFRSHGLTQLSPCRSRQTVPAGVRMDHSGLRRESRGSLNTTTRAMG